MATSATASKRSPQHGLFYAAGRVAFQPGRPILNRRVGEPARAVMNREENHEGHTEHKAKKTLCESRTCPGVLRGSLSCRASRISDRHGAPKSHPSALMCEIGRGQPRRADRLSRRNKTRAS